MPVAPPIHEPHKIKTVRRIDFPGLEERKRHLAEAGFNTFNLVPSQVVFDMVYRPHETRLLREAKEAGCTIVHGIDMLLYQAALQFERWTGTSCPIDAMRGAVSDLTGK